MEVIPIIKKVKDEILVYFPIEKSKAVEYLNKMDTHTFNFTCDDRRVKTYEQVKLFWALLDEFIEFKFPKEHIGQNEKNEIKLALYDEYKEEKKIKVSLSKSNVTSCRLFINWVIYKFADEYGFVSNSILLQNNFQDGYIYSTLINGKCAVCGESGKLVEKGKKVINLCYKHKKMDTKKLNAHHLEPIKITDELKQFIEGK